MRESRSVVARGWGKEKPWIAHERKGTGERAKVSHQELGGGCMCVTCSSKRTKPCTENRGPLPCVNHSSVKMILKYDAAFTIWAMEKHSQHSNKVS